MVKKVSFLLFSVAIVITGYIAFSKLNYWERSVRVFSNKSQAGRFERRNPGRVLTYEGRGEIRDPGRPGRPGMNGIPDSLRRRFEPGQSQREFRGRNVPDSLERTRIQRSESGRFDGSAFDRRTGNEARYRRGDFRGGKKINLRNIIWFLAVFASFTAITIYFDKLVRFLSKNLKRDKL